MFFFRCKHPWNRIAVLKKEELTGMDDDFEHRTTHMVCMKCGKELHRKFVTCIGGVDTFLGLGKNKLSRNS